MKITETHAEIAETIVCALEHWNQVSQQQNRWATEHPGAGGVGGSVEVYLCEDGRTDYYMPSTNTTPHDYVTTILTISEPVLDGADEHGDFDEATRTALLAHYTSEMPAILDRVQMAEVY